MKELEFWHEIDIEEIINKVKENLKEIDAFEIDYYTLDDDELLLNIKSTFNIKNTYTTHSFNFSLLKISPKKIIDHIKSALKRSHNYNLDDELHRIITLKNNIKTLNKL